MTSCKLSSQLAILAAGLIVFLLILTGFLFRWNDQVSSRPTPSPIPGSMRISPIDGMVLVYIPKGDFLMGDSKDTDSSPPHLVYLDAYWVDQTEVTNAMYAKCVQAGKCDYFVKQAATDIHFDDPAYENDPVVYVNWFQVVDYCQWAGRRLPTEAEWEKAARGTDKRIYPWGNAPPDWSMLNFDNLIGDTSPVASYLSGASPYGILDMAGNVREWMADWFDENYYQYSPRQDPLGPTSGDMRVLRGGSFIDNFQRVRVTNRFAHVPGSAGWNRGFRCAISQWISLR